MFHIFKEQPIEVVDITNPGKYSMLGKYFIGQTGKLTFGNNFNAWGVLINPYHSGVNLFFDIFTITNFSQQSFIGEIWISNKLITEGKTSSIVTPSNQAISPHPKPKAVLQFADNTNEPPKSGVNIFNRIVPQDSTLVSDSHKGSIIIGPGGSFGILLKSTASKIIIGTIVMTWWEENI